jgi:enediyne biosynthesis protein E4
MTRRPPRRAIVASGLVVALALAVAIGVAGLGLGRSITPTVAGGPPDFVEEARAAGIVHQYDGDTSFSTGGGLAVFDCNADGRPDLYLAGGAGPAALYRNDSPTGGALRFTRVPSPTTDLSGVTGAYPIDIDGDGVTDLVVLRNGENVLLHGLGGCRFERANERWAFDGGSSSTMAFSAKWEGTATLPTLAFGNYVDPSGPTAAGYTCQENELLRPAATGTGYGPSVPLTPSYCALSMLFSDWDRSGRMDLRVSNDDHYYPASDGEEQLWRIAPGKPPRLYTAADGWVSLQLEGMGIASYDVTGDGYPDVFLTSQNANRLQTLTSGPSQPTYRDIGAKRGVNAAKPFTGGDVRPSTAWHDEFEDVNNDGLIDLFISKGNVADQPDFAIKDPSNLLLGQPDGTFREAADVAGILSFARGRGAALADFNMDGMLDLIKVNYGAPVELWRNVGSGDAAAPAALGNWLALRVLEPGPNRDAIGAWIEVRVGDLTSRRELTIGGGHASGELGWVHVGLGPADAADVRVLWPGGAVGPWLRVAANHFEVIEQGATSAQVWQPPSP